MNKAPREVLLNRPVFTQEAFNSRSLTVLTTLLHHFPDAGQYQVRVRNGNQPEQQFGVRVSPDHTKHQVNVDLATLGDAGGGCGCEPKGGYELAVGGVMGFYPSAGIGGYRVVISQVGEKEKRVILDNHEAVPAGDFFAVTLTRPGQYQLSEESTKAEAEVRVSLPRGERVRTDQPTLVVLDRDGFNTKEISFQSGQSLVVQFNVAARLRITLAKADAEDDGPATRKRYTVHQRSTRRVAKSE